MTKQHTQVYQQILQSAMSHAPRLLTLCLAMVSLLGVRAQEIEIEMLDLGKPAQAIYPTVYDSVLYFASDKKWDLGKTYFNQKDAHLFQIFSTEIRNGQPYGRPKPAMGSGNKPYNMFAVSFDQNGTAYVTRNNMKTSVLRGAPMGIFAYYDMGAHSEGTLMSNLPEDANNGMATVSADGTFMVFASDMMGGEGRTDLYYCERKGGGWSEPVNMGPVVNTPGVETAPYIHPSGKIFFSSNGRNDSQSLDIYFTYKTDKGFAEPEKFDDVVNSVRDDYGLFYSEDERWGFVTSNRDGDDQIYYFWRTFPTFENQEEQQEVELCYTLYEASAENYDTTSFECKWSFGDGTWAKGIEVDHCYAKHGTYTVELSVLDKTSGEEMFSLAQYELDIEKPNQVEIVVPENIRAGKPVTFTAITSALKDFYPRALYWNINGVRSKGKQATYTFEKPGTYRVECGTIDARRSYDKRCSWLNVVVK